MHKTYRVAIVGGGAAGLMSAVEFVYGKDYFSGDDIVIVERNDRVGKKLITTGNGQGNLMNEKFSSENYYGQPEFINEFCKKALEIDLESYLYGIGIPLVTAKDGKKYPLSKQASSVLDIIRFILSEKGVQIITDSKVLNVKKQGDVFELKTENNLLFAENVVIATGGKCAKQFGTDGTSYALLESFGHTLTKTYPSLVQLKCDLSKIRGLKGLKENARITAIINGREIKSAVGDVLFTEYGISGNAVFQISGHLTGEDKGQVKIEFLPDLTISEVEKLLTDREKHVCFSGENKLVGIINKRIGQSIIKSTRSQSAIDVAKALKDFRLNVTGDLGFNYAQVTKGGIKTDKFNPDTMESQLVKGLYAVGEVLDIDGDCGGYNLTFAFVSGIVAAKSIKNNYKEKTNAKT